MEFYRTKMEMDLTKDEQEKLPVMIQQPDLIQQLQTEYISSNDRNVSYPIKGCPLLISLNLNLLIDLHSEIARSSIISFAIDYGTKLLRMFPGVDSIQKSRALFYQYASGEDRSALRAWFTNKDFAINGEVQRVMPIYVAESALRENHQLANSVGMTHRISMILSIFASLLGASEIPFEDRMKMVEALKMFKNWLSHRAEKAEDYRKRFSDNKLLINSKPAIKQLTSFEKDVLE